MTSASSTIRLRNCFGLVLAVALAACAGATTVIPPDLAKLANESDYVVQSVVTSVHSEYRDGPEGRAIVTKVGIDVREVITGRPPRVVVLEMLGGRIGDDEMIVEGAPRFKVGDVDVLFVKDNGRAIYPLLAIMYGRYPILRDPATGREYVARSNHLPLADGAEIGLPVVTGAAAELQRRLAGPAVGLSPAQFAQQIKAAIDPGYLRARQR